MNYVVTEQGTSAPAGVVWSVSVVGLLRTSQDTLQPSWPQLTGGQEHPVPTPKERTSPDIATGP